MKRRLLRVFALATLLTLFASTHAMAQLSWEVGVVGGVNIADITGDDAGDIGTRTGFVGGGLVMAHISDTFGIRFEGLYTQKGASEDSAGVEVTFALDYIEIPVLAVLSTDVSDGASISAFLGPAFAFNTSAKIKGEESGVEVEVDIGELVKAFDFGGVVGIGASFAVGSVNIVLDGRWTYGFTSIDDTGADEDIRNSVFGFMGGITFPIPTG